MLPRKSSSVCILTAPLVRRKCAQGNRLKHKSIVVGVKLPGLTDQPVGQVGVNAPVAGFVGVGQGGAGNLATQSQMVELRATRTQARFDVAQTFAISQLGEGQTEELIPTREAADFVVAAIAGDATLELLRMNPVEQLSQDELAVVHGRKIATKPAPAESADSNRSHSQNDVSAA
jgi:hypothetical protein